MIYLKYLRKFNSKESITAICQKYGITNYTINDDGSIDVNDYVDLSNGRLTKLPLKFRNVTDNFFCDNNRLTTLEGAPRTVGGNFNCSNNQLTTLEGAPRKVGRYFYCNNNKLVNLEFVPSCQKIYCSNNLIYKWWSKVDDITKLDAFIDLGIDSRDPDFMNAEKIDLLLE